MHAVDRRERVDDLGDGEDLTVATGGGERAVEIDGDHFAAAGRPVDRRARRDGGAQLGVQLLVVRALEQLGEHHLRGVADLAAHLLQPAAAGLADVGHEEQPLFAVRRQTGGVGRA